MNDAEISDIIACRFGKRLPGDAPIYIAGELLNEVTTTDLLYPGPLMSTGNLIHVLCVVVDAHVDGTFTADHVPWLRLVAQRMKTDPDFRAAFWPAQHLVYDVAAVAIFQIARAFVPYTEGGAP